MPFAIELGLKFDLESEFAKLRAELNRDISVDYLVSRGEYLTARLMSEYLGYAFVDASECVFFAYDGQIDFERTYTAIAERALRAPRFVMPGFYGALPNGRIRVMSRGGSDITGAIVANALDADIYENWTDVSGILMADPKVVSDPKPIEMITYQELRELSYMGASVLHEESILPVKEKNIPLNIRNTNRPQDAGTMILDSIDDAAASSGLITGIAGRRSFTVLTIYKKHISTDTRIIRRTLEMLEMYKVEVEHITLGVDSFNVVLPTAQISDRIYDIIADIKRELRSRDRHQDGRQHRADRLGGPPDGQRAGQRRAKLFGALGENNINIRMIARAPRRSASSSAWTTRTSRRTIRALYDRLCRNKGGDRCMKKQYNVAISGRDAAPSASRCSSVLEEQRFPVGKLLPLASARSAGKTVRYSGVRPSRSRRRARRPLQGMDFVLGAVSNAHGARNSRRRSCAAGAVFVDNSSAFRMDGRRAAGRCLRSTRTTRGSTSGIIANPNCSTIITLVAISGIAPPFAHRAHWWPATYQAVSGAGAEGMNGAGGADPRLRRRTSRWQASVFPCQIAFKRASRRSARSWKTATRRRK